MATEQAKGIKAPKDDNVPDSGEDVVRELGPDEGQENANILGYRGPDGSKSLGYLAHPPVGDRSGLGADADDAGRLAQAEGQNSGAGAPTNVETDTAKARAVDRRETERRDRARGKG